MTAPQDHDHERLREPVPVTGATTGPDTFWLVVPVKTLSRAKSRLRGFHDDVRPELMRAFALDALTAALACDRVAGVHVVTDEPDLAGQVRDLGCTVLPDVGGGDLNRALAAAVAGLDPRHRVAAMLGDLPCLRTGDLSDALAAVSGPTFVADADGTGTTLLAAPGPASFAPRFGMGSAAAHRAGGATEVGLAVPTLRRDVDTANDLAAAVSLGVGPHTAAVLAQV